MGEERNTFDEHSEKGSRGRDRRHRKENKPSKKGNKKNAFPFSVAKIVLLSANGLMKCLRLLYS
jgi:hypothetical protein